MNCQPCGFQGAVFRCGCSIARCVSCLLAFCHVTHKEKGLEFCCTQCCKHNFSCISIELECIYQNWSGESKRCSTQHGWTRLCVDERAKRYRIVPLCDFHMRNFEQEKVKKNIAWKCMEKGCLQKGICWTAGHSDEALFHCLKHGEQWYRGAFDNYPAHNVDCDEYVIQDRKSQPERSPDAKENSDDARSSDEEREDVDSEDQDLEQIDEDFEEHPAFRMEDWDKYEEVRRALVAKARRENPDITDIYIDSPDFLPCQETPWKSRWGPVPEEANAGLVALRFAPNYRKRSKKFYTLLEKWLSSKSLQWAVPPPFSCSICHQQGLVCTYPGNSMSTAFSPVKQYRQPFKDILSESLPLALCVLELIQEYAQPLPYLFACNVLPQYEYYYNEGSKKITVRKMILHWDSAENTWNYDTYTDSLWICYECVCTHETDKVIKKIDKIIETCSFSS
jgi:hypothetical protein